MLKLSQQRKAFCSYPFQRLKVDPEGNCTFCCFHTRRCLGNILDKGLEAIWNSPLAEQIRASTLANTLHPTCDVASCPLQHRKSQLQTFSFVQKSFPTQLEIDLPNQHCNIGGENPTPDTACLMCERARHFVRQEDRLNEVCSILRPYARHFTDVHIQGVAEPFWKDRIFEIIDLLGLRSQTRITTTTNGTTLGPERMKRWLTVPNTSTTFSIDAATAETFRKIRRLDAYDLVIKTLITYGESRSRQQYFQIHNNINMLNIDEVEEMVVVASLAKVDHISFNPTYNLPGLEVDKDNVLRFQAAQEAIIKKGRECNVSVGFLRDFTLGFLEPQVIPLSGVK